MVVRKSAPFLARDVEEALATGGPLRLEGDTTGLATTADMPGVAPGLIEGRLQPGFQMASLSLRTPHYRVVLGSAHFNEEVAHWRDKMDRAQGRAQAAEERGWELHFLIRQTQQEVERLEPEYVGRHDRVWSAHFRVRYWRSRRATLARVTRNLYDWQRHFKPSRGSTKIVATKRVKNA